MGSLRQPQISSSSDDIYLLRGLFRCHVLVIGLIGIIVRIIREVFRIKRPYIDRRPLLANMQRCDFRGLDHFFTGRINLQFDDLLLEQAT
jgi:hypothetical protein